MKYLRGLLAVALGYLILAGVSMGIVASLFGSGPEPEMKKILFSMAGLAFGSMIAGFVAR